MRKLLLSLASASILLSSTAFAADIDTLRSQGNMYFKPLPKAMPGSEDDSKEKIALGEKLYFETALSVNGEQSCNSCHQLDGKQTGVDNLRVSPGAIEGKEGDRNSPTVWNAGLHFVQFWDGRAADLKEQAKGPILNPVEMAIPDEATAVNNLKKAGYEDEFKKVFGANDALTYDNIAEAIAAFERTLITKDRFDDFLNGDDKALNEEELEGLQNFISVGCIACHQGPLLGGQMYQKMGLVNAYPNKEDKGRYEETGNEFDRYMFKVPSLRDISRTAPYFHDGKAETLEDAVEQMAYYQIGRTLDKETTASIVAFLKTLENQRKLELSVK